MPTTPTGPSGSASPPPATLEQARRAKDQLASTYGDAPWCRGYGIAPLGEGFALRVNVAPGTPSTTVPRLIDGVPVLAVEIEGYKPR